MVICLERDADMHMAQLMPLPLTVSCFSKMQIGFTFLVPVLNVCVCGVCVCVCVVLKTKQLITLFSETTHSNHHFTVIIQISLH